MRLRVDDLFVLQGLIQSVWIELHFLLELLDVPRIYLLCRNVTLDSTFFCVRTLLQVSLQLFRSEMNLTLSFLSGSNKLVIGRHLPLSPVSTPVKPAYPVIAHHSNPIQEGESQCFQLNHSRCHARSLKDHWWNLCIVHFTEIVELIMCRHLRFSQWAESRNVMWIVAVVVSL